MNFARFWARALFVVAIVAVILLLPRKSSLPPPMKERPAPPKPSSRRKAIDDGLAWLARAQEGDGRWSCSRWSTCGGKTGLPCIPDHVDELLDPAVSGLALLPFLHDKNTSGAGQHSNTVAQAIDYLRMIDGGYVQRGLPRYESRIPSPWHWGTVAEEYNPVVSYAALAEALSLGHEERLRHEVEGFVQQMCTVKRPDRPWARTLSPFDIGPVVFWVELFEAAEAARIHVPSSARDDGRAYLREMTEAKTGRIVGKDVCPECLGGWDAQAVAVLLRGWIDPAEDEVREAEVATIAAHPPVWETQWKLPEDESQGVAGFWRCSRDIVNYYYWYYGLLALQRFGGEREVRWRKALVETLVAHQVHEGPNAGSWEPLDPWGRMGGRVYSTSYAVLCLLACPERE